MRLKNNIKKIEPKNDVIAYTKDLQKKVDKELEKKDVENVNIVEASINKHEEVKIDIDERNPAAGNKQDSESTL